MASQTKPHYTPEEHLAIERGSEEKSEYYGGEIFAMGGASERHNLKTVNIAAGLHAQLRGRPCKVYMSDMRVKVNSIGLYTYPDIVALCGEARFDDEQKDTLLNPALIIEVLSKSTEAYNRGEKFAHYRKVDSLKEYLLISQERHQVDHYVRQPDNHWLLTDASSLEDTIKLTSINCVLALNEIYDKVELETKEGEG